MLDELTKPPSTSLVCGIETRNSSEWISLGGPIKGSFVVKLNLINPDDSFIPDVISDFGMYVDDPCQIVNNVTSQINVDP